MKFYGTGSVWDGAKNKNLCSFVNGIYETEDQAIISKLVEIGFKYEGELEFKYDKGQKEIESLKSEIKELKSIEKQVDPKILEKIELLEKSNTELKQELTDCARAKELLIEKAIECKIITKKDAKGLNLFDITEIISQNVVIGE